MWVGALWNDAMFRYGVVTMSRRFKIIGLFCKRVLQKRRYSAEETYNFKAPTNRSHNITDWFIDDFVVSGVSFFNMCILFRSNCGLALCGMTLWASYD